VRAGGSGLSGQRGMGARTAVVPVINRRLQQLALVLTACALPWFTCRVDLAAYQVWPWATHGASRQSAPTRALGEETVSRVALLPAFYSSP